MNYIISKKYIISNSLTKSDLYLKKCEFTFQFVSSKVSVRGKETRPLLQPWPRPTKQIPSKF